MERVKSGNRSTYQLKPRLCFTPREKQVLELLFAFRANKEIAQALNITERTVKFHAASIYRKTGIPESQRGKGKLMLLTRLGKFEVKVNWIQEQM